MVPPEQTRSAAVTADGAADSADLSNLLPQVYGQLRELARQKMAQERDGHTLQTTALVHEAYLRLFGSGRVKFESRRHFFHAAAEAMRRILIEHARGRDTSKRGGGRSRVPLNLVDAADELDHADLVALDELIEKLEQKCSDAATIVRLRFYAGLTVSETAATLGVTSRTVDRWWKYARAWLVREWEKAEAP